MEQQKIYKFNANPKYIEEEDYIVYCPECGNVAKAYRDGLFLQNEIITCEHCQTTKCYNQNYD